MIGWITCLLAVIVTIPGRVPDKEPAAEVSSFYATPLEDRETKTIRKIVCTVAEKNLLQLGLENKSLRKIGKKINHVHPLKFAGYIFADPYLKQCMREIGKSRFKWRGFVRGFTGRMTEEAMKDNLNPHLTEFAEHLGIKENDLAVYINNKDWEGLLRFLLTI